MAGGRPIPTAPIAPNSLDIMGDGVTEVESERAGNAKFGYAVHTTDGVGLAAGNVGFDAAPPPDSGPTPFGQLTGKR